MAGYIKSGLGIKNLLSPKIEVWPNQWMEIEKECEILDKLLAKLRPASKADNNYYYAHLTDESREIIKRLSKLESLQHEILMSANPEYREYWYGN